MDNRRVKYQHRKSTTAGSLAELVSLWGADLSIQDSPTFLAAVQQVDQSIELIEYEDKQDFLVALSAAPMLVATESNPLSFLGVEDMNPWAAATRLALYWKHRKSVFGERWLRPIDLSGYGALTPNDAENLKKGCATLRNSPEVTVVLSDFNRVVSDPDGLLPSRAAFFVSSCVRNVIGPQHNVILIHTVAPYQFLRRKGTVKGRAFEIIHSALPYRVKKYFLLSRPNSFLEQSIIQTCFSMLGMVAEFFSGNSPVLISESRKDEAFLKLRSYGVPVHCIPMFLGGTWNSEGVVFSDLESFSSENLTQKSSAAKTAGSRGSPGAETKQSRPRKRGRPANVLTEEAERELRAECNDEEEFLKKRNALYSRRLYYKKKNQEEDLKKQIERIERNNGSLKVDNERLEDLLAKARRHVS